MTEHEDGELLEQFEESLELTPQESAENNINFAAAQDQYEAKQEGEVIDNAVRTGRDIETVRGQSLIAVEKMKRQARLDSLDNKIEVAEWLAEDPRNSIISLRDIDNLQSLLNKTRTMSALPNIDRGTFLERSEATFLQTGAGVFKGIGQLSSQIYGLLGFGAELFGSDASDPDSIAGRFAENALIGRELVPTLRANSAGATPEAFEVANILEVEEQFKRFQAFGVGLDDVVSGAVSLAPSLVGGVLLSGASRAVQLAGFATVAGGQSFGAEFAEQRFAGETFGESAKQATLSGLITALLTRAIPGGVENGLANLTRAMSASAAPKQILRASLIKALGRNFVSEFTEEGLDELLQSLLVEGTSWEEAIEAGLKGGIIGGILGGGVGLQAHIVQTRMQQYEDAEQFFDQLTDLGEELEKSETRKNSSEKAAQFMQTQGGLDRTGYIDGLAAQEIADQPEGQQQLKDLGISQNDIQASIETGSVIPFDLARSQTILTGPAKELLNLKIRQSAASPNQEEVNASSIQEEAELANSEEAQIKTKRQDFESQLTRLANEVADASGPGINVDVARDSLAPLSGQLWRLWTRHPNAFKDPAGLLERIKFQKGIEGIVPRGTTLTQDLTTEANDVIRSSVNLVDGLDLGIKAQRKQWVRQQPVPSELVEDPDLYFIPELTDALLPIDDVVSEFRDDTAVNAAKLMQGASEGKLAKRAPVQVRLLPDGTYEALDGNSTIAAARRYGWENIPVLIADEPGINRPVEIDELPPERQDAAFESFIRTQWDQTFDSLYAVAQGLQDELNAFGAEVADEVGVRFTAADIKTRSKAEEKAGPTRKNYDNLGRITDVVRSGFILENPDQGVEIINKLAERYELINEGWVTTPAGYFDRKVLIRFPGGTVAEIQFWEPRLLEAKQNGGGHDLFEIQRKLPKDDPRIEQLTSQMLEVYLGAVVRMPPEWLNVYTFDSLRIPSGSIGSVGNILEKLSADTILPESITSATLTETQPPPSDITATADVSESTAGLPSQLTKEIPGIDSSLTDSPPTTSNTQIAKDAANASDGTVELVDEDELGDSFDSRQSFYQSGFDANRDTLTAEEIQDATERQEAAAGAPGQAIQPGITQADIGQLRGFAKSSKRDAGRIRGIDAIARFEDGSGPPLLQLPKSTQGAELFFDLIQTNKETNKFGSSVFVHSAEEYKKMKMYVTPDGDLGFALNGDDIVSVFSNRKGDGSIHTALELAIAEGGRRLDAFDTVLPGLYAEHGFRAVSRVEFIDEFAPPDWDKELYASFNNGEPDVVFMVFDPERAEGDGYTPGEGELVETFDEAEEIQLAAVPDREPIQLLQGQKRATVTIVDQRYIVNLFDNADLSTVLHETGHIFLEEIRNIISTGDASEDLMKDWDAIADWQVTNRPEHLEYLRGELEIADEERSNKLNKAITFMEDATDAELKLAALDFGHNVDQATDGLAETFHELWARGTEAYLAEGKSPSVKLDKAFRRFAKWLSKIYTNINGIIKELNVRLTPEVRDVFNRLMATEAEITHMSILNEFTSRSVDELDKIPGVTPAKVQKLNKVVEDARDRMASELLKTRAKAAQRARREFRADVTDEPLYRAWASIKLQGGLRHIQILSEFGQDTINELRKKGLISKTADTGAIPDDVANTHGFEDSTDLVINLLDALPPEKEVKRREALAVTRAELKETSIEAVLESPEIEKALNEVGKFLHDAFRGDLPFEEQRVLEAIADRQMSEMLVFNATKTHEFLGNMSRKIKEGRRHMARDEFQEATNSNRESRLQLEMSKISKDIKKRIEKLTRKARKLRTVNPESIEYAYRFYALQKAEEFGILPKSSRELPIPTDDEGNIIPLAKLLADLAQQEGVDASPLFEPWLISNSDPLHGELVGRFNLHKPKTPRGRGARRMLDVLKTHELTDLDNFISFLDGTGRELRKATINQGKEVLNEIVAESQTFMGKVTDKGIIFDVNSYAGTIAEKVDEGLLAPQLITDFLYRTIDGFNGPTFGKIDESRPMFRAVMIPSDQADSAKEERFEEIDKLLDEPQIILSKAVRRIGKNPDVNVAVPQRMRDAGKKHWDGSRILAVMLNAGNQYNLDGMARGFDWFTADGEPDTSFVYEFASLFTETELRAIQAMGDGVDTLWNDARRVHQELWKFPPSKVNGDPITFYSSDGKAVLLPGWYWPLKFDRRDKRTNQKMQDDISDLKDGGHSSSFAPAKLKRNALMARKNTGGKMILLEPDRVLKGHLDYTINLITHGEYIRDTRRILNHPLWQESARKTLGDSAFAQLHSGLRAEAGNEIVRLNGVDELVQQGKTKASLFILAGKVKGIISTMDAIPTLIADVGLSTYMRGVQSVLNTNGWKRIKFMIDSSPPMRARLKGGWDRDAKAATDDALNLRRFGLFTKARQNIAHFAMAFYSYPSLGYEAFAWLGMYDKTMAKTGDHETSVSVANLAIESSQPSARVRSQSALLRDKKSYVALLTMLSTWAHTRLNSNRFAFNALTRDTAEDKITTGEYLGYFFVTNVLSTFPLAMLYAIYAAVGDDDEDKAVARFFKEVAKGSVADTFRGLPLVGDLLDIGAETIIDGRSFEAQMRGIGSRSAAISVPARVLTHGVVGMYDTFGINSTGDERLEGLWNMAQLLSFTSGIPATPIFEQLNRGLQSLTND